MSNTGCATPSGAISFLFMCNSSKLGKQQLLRGKRRRTIFALLFITKRKPVSEVEEAILRRQKCARAFHFHISHLNGSSENVMNKKSKQENILLSVTQRENTKKANKKHLDIKLPKQRTNKCEVKLNYINLQPSGFRSCLLTGRPRTR